MPIAAHRAPCRASPIMPSPNRYWHKAWTVDLEQRTAKHQIGLVVRFERDDEDLLGHAAPESAETAFRALLDQQTQAEATQMMARLMREAGEAFRYAEAKAHYDASTNQRKRAKNHNKIR